MAGNPGVFQYHHQPFVYFKRFENPESEDRKAHLKDEQDFFRDIASGTLPQVSFIKPYQDFHPEYSNLPNGQPEVLLLLDFTD
jgi:phospholipase C